MAKVTDLEVVRAERKEPCPYCGKEEHVTPFACPSVSGITAYANIEQVDIHFWPAEGDSDGPVAA